MDRNDDAFRTPNRAGWRITALIAGVWALGCPLAGVVLAILSGEFGSIGFVVVGLYVGVVGGLVHASLTRSTWFLGLSYPWQVIMAAAGAALPLLVFLVFRLTVVRGGPAFGVVEVFVLPICGFAIAAAWVAAEILHRQSAWRDP